LVSLLLLNSCAASTPTATPTTVPTIQIPTSTEPAPTATPEPVETAYPVGSDMEQIQETAYPYPAADGTGPGGMPMRDNRSQMTAKLIEQAPDPGNPDLIRLHVLVIAVEEIPGIANLTSGLVNQETDLYVQASKMITIQPGDTFIVEVSYRGDEHGVKIYVIDFTG
jgi:hypothetical protein